MMAKYRRSVSMMYDQLFSKSHELSGIAAACLSSIGGDRIAEKLLVELSVPQCPTETKVAIMSCLSSLKSHNFRTRIAARLLLVLKDKNEKRQLREAAAYGLSGVLRDVGKSRKIYRNAVRSLAFALLDPSPCLRGNAVFSLGSLRAKEYRKRLEAISRTDHAKCYGPADKGTAWTVAKEAKVALRKIDQEPATSQ
jgi:HEAT repeat protein